MGESIVEWNKRRGTKLLLGAFKRTRKKTSSVREERRGERKAVPVAVQCRRNLHKRERERVVSVSFISSLRDDDIYLLSTTTLS